MSRRYFEPATAQALTGVDGQPLAITICEDAWNDKGFWPSAATQVDPVEELMVKWGSRAEDLSGCSASF